MKDYLVMECRMGYAVVLSKSGEFIKVANLNYEVGQAVDDVVIMNNRPKRFNRRFKLIGFLAFLAVIMSVFAYRFCFAEYGAVRLDINPDVIITVSRGGMALDVDDLNEDGDVLKTGYGYSFKTAKKVCAELVDRAVAMGYLTDGGTIVISAVAPDDDWSSEMENKIIEEVKFRIYGRVQADVVTVSEAVQNEDTGMYDNWNHLNGYDLQNGSDTLNNGQTTPNNGNTLNGQTAQQSVQNMQNGQYTQDNSAYMPDTETGGEYSDITGELASMIFSDAETRKEIEEKMDDIMEEIEDYLEDEYFKSDDDMYERQKEEMAREILKEYLKMYVEN